MYRDMLTQSTPVSERVHSALDIDLMLDYIHKHQEKYPAYLPAYSLELQILMGLRRGEIPPLEWTDIHDDQYILIHRIQITVKKGSDNPKEYFQIVNHTKTYKDRRFPITKDVKAFLDRLRYVHERYYPDSNYLFPADSANGVITNNTVYNFYRRMCKTLNIKISRDVVNGPHSYRRNDITKVVKIRTEDPKWRLDSMGIHRKSRYQIIILVLIWIRPERS